MSVTSSSRLCVVTGQGRSGWEEIGTEPRRLSSAAPEGRP